jgi:hypothetical protein
MNQTVAKYNSPQVALLARCCKEIGEAMQAAGRSNVKARILVQEWNELTDPARLPQNPSEEEIAALNARAQSLFNRLKEFVVQQLTFVTF